MADPPPASSSPAPPSSSSPPKSADDPPPLELDTLVSSYYKKYSHLLPPLLLLADLCLCILIVLKVPYTEIDWASYMQQVKLWRGGEWDYRKLRGDTGPLVYPVWHLYLYTGLGWVAGGDGGDVRTAQWVFVGVYLVQLGVVMACYRRAGAPVWLLGLCVCSKRLHSVFLLRLFNDCWVGLGLWVCVYALQRRWWTAGTAVWALSVGIKMTGLLAGPGLGVVLLQGLGLADSFFVLAYMGMLQVASAWPFLYREVGFTYFWAAFDFGRVFEYRWTVNWKFVPEKLFLSREFAITLMVWHVTLLGVFVAKRWLRPSGYSPRDFVRMYFLDSRGLGEKEEQEISARTNATFVMDTMLASVVIGLLCARTLHYQFYAYLGWATPYLLWRSKMPGIMVIVLWATQEFYWNVYPSTEKSSGAVVMLLALQLMTILNAGDEGMPKKTDPKAVVAAPQPKTDLEQTS